MANFIENFFSSVFGGAPKTQAQSTTTTTSSPALPAEIAPFAKEALGEAQRLYQMRGQEGYTPYTGEQLAGFTPEQQKAFQGISSLVGTSGQYFDPAARLAASSAIAPTSESVQQFMSPYMQNVVDIQQREARRQADIAANQLAGQAVTGAGGFGGSRQAILEAELGRNTQQLLGDIQAKGLAAAYEDAQTRLAQQRQREAGAANLFGQFGVQAPASALQELQALQGAGAVQQAQQQAGLDIARKQFEEERAFPEQQLSTYMNFIRGTPTATGGTTTQTALTPAPSYLQQLAGLGLGAAGIAKAFPNTFNFKEGGKIGKGGLSSIVVKRSKGGPIRLQLGGGGPEIFGNNPNALDPSIYLQRALSGLQAADPSALYGAEQRYRESMGIGAAAKRSIADQIQEAAQKYGAQTEAEKSLLQRLAEREGKLPEQEAAVRKEMEDRRKSLESQKWLELANVGFRLASPEGGSKGLAQDIARSMSPSTKTFSDIAQREAELASQQRKELEGLSDKQLDTMFKRAGIESSAGQRAYNSTIAGLKAKEDVADLDAQIAKSTYELESKRGADQRAIADSYGKIANYLLDYGQAVAKANGKDAKLSDLKDVTKVVQTSLYGYVLGPNDEVRLPSGKTLEQSEQADMARDIKNAVDIYYAAGGGAAGNKAVAAYAEKGGVKGFKPSGRASTTNRQYNPATGELEPVK